MQETWSDPRVGKILWRREWLPTPVNIHDSKTSFLTSQSWGFIKITLSRTFKVTRTADGHRSASVPCHILWNPRKHNGKKNGVQQGYFHHILYMNCIGNWPWWARVSQALLMTSPIDLPRKYYGIFSGNLSQRLFSSSRDLHQGWQDWHFFIQLN